MKIGLRILGLAALVGTAIAAWNGFQTPQVGHHSASGMLVADGQFIKPIGKTVLLKSRPVDLALSHDGRFAYLKEGKGLTVVDCDTLTIVKQIPIVGGDSFYGIALSEDGKTLVYTTATDKVVVFSVNGSDLVEQKSITLPAARAGKQPHPCGIAFEDPGHVFVCLNRDNSVARVNLTSGAIEKWDTDAAPFAVSFDRVSRRLFVSCWSRKAAPGEPQADSSGTSVPVDVRGVGLGGRLSVIDLGLGRQTASVPIGHHPAEIDVAGDELLIPSSGSDAIDHVAIKGLKHRVHKLFPNQPVGAAPASLVLSPDGGTAFIACSGRNSILKVDMRSEKLLGEYPTAWYPTTVRLKNGHLYVAGTKGVGERGLDDTPKGHNSWDLTGALCVIDVSEKPQPIAFLPEPAARRDIAPTPMPERVGERSLIKHVVYVIRENRTYDQIFGDMKEGDGDPSLCNFGESVTPNAHALAREYGLLDNYYCNGICSADGHSWATEGNTTANLERSVPGWPRSYPFGDDALNTSSTGFLWDDALEAHKSFLNFGEFDYASTANKETYFDCLKEHYAGTSNIKFKQNIGVARMAKFAEPGFPGWDLSIPDVLRADIFIRSLKKMEAKGTMPDLTILYLPCDHTGGPVTARAQVADNDLALGMCVEALTKSKFWKDTCVFVEEDDPQAGWDHVDGHRSPCLVISPYSRGLGRISDFYNQTSILRSIEHILGLKSKSWFVSTSPVMFSCFTSKFDATTYTAKPNQVSLDETSQKKVVSRFDVSKPDLIDDKAFNRSIWKETMPGKPYPAAFEGAHGKGLASKGLVTLPLMEKTDRD